MKKIWAIMVAGLLAGCLGGYSPHSSFYNLRPIQGAEVSSRKISIGVNSAELPDYLDKPQIVSFDEGRPQMNIAELERWGEPLDSMIQRVVAADIGNCLPQALVKVRSSLLEKFNFLVDVQIIRFDMIKGQGAVLEAWWYISNENGIILARHKTTLEQNTKGGYDAYVDAQSQLLAQMSREIAAAAAKL